MGCPCYRRTPRTLPRPLATLVTLASTQLASDGLQGCRLVELMARSPLPRACDRCRFGERTFAGTRGSDGNAPTPAVRPTTASRRKSTLSDHSWLRAGDGLGDRRDKSRHRSRPSSAACSRCGRVVVSLRAIFSIQGGLPQRWPRPAVSPPFSPPTLPAIRG